MRTHIQHRFAAPFFTLGLFAILCLQSSIALGQTTAFVFQDLVNQGHPSDLMDGKAKIGDGAFTFSFRLATAETGSNYIGDPITNNVIIAASQFSTTLDFGNVYDGQPRWVEIARKVGKDFVTLTPRQLLPSAPDALYASTAGSVAASNVSGASVTIDTGAGLAGGGTVNLGGTLTISNTGVRSVTGSGSILASTLNGVVTLSDNATNGNVSDTIVERDSSGNFSANNVALNGLSLPDPGSIQSGGSAVFYSDGSTGNFFAGLAAGNPANDTGSDNTASGCQSLYNNGNASGNAGGGASVGNNNTANGYQSLYNNGNVTGNAGDGGFTIGNDNTASGYQSLYNNGNVANNAAGGGFTVGNDNTAYGYQALYNNGLYSGNASGGGIDLGNNNTAVGYQALYNIAGVSNNAFGGGVTAGNNNIALGYQAGMNIVSGSGNIEIGVSGPGDENNTVRIGNPSVQTATYLAGTVYANDVALTSDRNAKEQFEPVNARAVLEKVAALPISEWKFKTDGVQHLGPMAQDFKAAFNLGADDKHIAVVDEGGVALAAVQGLNQNLIEQAALLKAKDAEIQELKRSLEQLTARIETLARQPNTAGAR